MKTFEEPDELKAVPGKRSISLATKQGIIKDHLNGATNSSLQKKYNVCYYTVKKIIRGFAKTKNINM